MIGDPKAREALLDGFAMAERKIPPDAQTSS
jgi:hypothetical protein